MNQLSGLGGLDRADLMAVRRAALEAIELCRKRQGPVFIEAATTRWPGSRHIMPKLDTGLTDLSLAWEPQRIAGEHAVVTPNAGDIAAAVRKIISKT